VGLRKATTQPSDDRGGPAARQQADAADERRLHGVGGGAEADSGDEQMRRPDRDNSDHDAVCDQRRGRGCPGEQLAVLAFASHGNVADQGIFTGDVLP
jgi:hypothetical protein